MEVELVESDSENTVAGPSASATSTSVNGEQPISTSYILDGEYFSIEKATDKKVLAKCMKCNKQISGTTLSTGNFLSHYKVSSEIKIMFFLEILFSKNFRSSMLKLYQN